MPDANALQEYARKRDFSGTPEPRGEAAAPADEYIFVVQKHDASHLHYDFRLELDGVLKSWAVPKGPCLDPSVKRLAIEVEDHPLDYARFEGHIPEGHYGAGDVIVWDEGRWQPLGDPHAGLKSGHLKFRLQGRKLSGSWNLVRTRMPGRQPQWFIIKGRDGEARDFPRFDILAKEPLSVLSGQPLPSEMTAPASNRGLAGKPAKKPAATSAKPAAPRKSARQRLPERFAPQLATLVDAPPAGDWRYEIKIDGYRILARLDHGNVRLLTRNGHDWSAKLPELCKALAGLEVDSAWLDGEILVVDEEGRPDFQRLQNAFDAGLSEAIRYTLFDLLWLDGMDYRDKPLEERRAALQDLLRESSSDRLRYSEDFTDDPRSILDSACRLGLEGLIGKRAGSRYVERRSGDWIKLKCKRRQEFVIVGYSEPKGSRTHFGALLLGLHDKDGELRYAGKVGTGFSATSLKAIHQQLQPLVRQRCPLKTLPKGQDARGVTWLRPQLLGEVAFAEITREGLVRQAVFHGLRSDKPAREIVREEPRSTHKRSPGAAAGRGNVVAGIAITHPDRVVDPGSALHKIDVARYYEQAAERILPWLGDRPVSLVRAPDGVGGEQFFQRHASRTELPGVEQLEPRLDPGHAPLLRIANTRGLVGAAQMGVLELHTWNASVDDLEKPDRFILDLDPDPALPWKRMIEATRLTLTLLDELGLSAFLKTSGGKGMHILVPLRRDYGWDEVKDFAHAISRHMAKLMPDRFSAISGPKNRIGKIFIDYLRNTRGASTVCVWSVRARDGLPVSVPISRDELADLKGANAWNIQNVAQRLGGPDPWSAWPSARQQRLGRKMWQQLEG
ncbi:DNA ligase D [Pseudomonas sp. ZM23]|uniref:DNA ligase (ATP) n=1 Tax=Pseudomonas triclosanedens TaxID=2961893 RepID=A0ABY7A536_9PSED|nr:DNA ligase D [Pseudomonas triclosanedens]MCP8466241.1 DNA ligase D [Pseudomonas triclosanedens]MCP8471767.1 DNA ligase D [Pseudomonas triclosanedens]MCP8478880.1 DNA ligase D [Pseudomonas triclosanedens]WAI52341.1 DNA ligase D [Pseudomonas triclosanedens]